MAGIPFTFYNTCRLNRTAIDFMSVRHSAPEEQGLGYCGRHGSYSSHYVRMMSHGNSGWGLWSTRLLQYVAVLAPTTTGKASLSLVLLLLCCCFSVMVGSTGSPPSHASRTVEQGQPASAGAQQASTSYCLHAETACLHFWVCISGSVNTAWPGHHWAAAPVVMIQLELCSM